ncbi:ATP-binding protein [Pseudofrankia sp. BMG5.37]|uniref:ATP-binding protein n=1 Tax=Pseudofrankia sp. BMG5.37 TaxID=3050035 RepID=UPI002895C13D|nr:ATP-binding protein [Pseudofrankia sp. BMG5.37]MDT3442932.1 ATP-binding protein [Pseudofrankia sp. BMG5.37]
MTRIEPPEGRDPNRLPSGSPRTPELSTASAATKALPVGVPPRPTVRDEVKVTRSVVRWLAATQAAQAVARRQAQATLSGWRLLLLLDDARLVNRELVANAVNACKAARAGGPDHYLDWIAIRLTDTGRRLTIEVFDAAPGVPAHRATDPLTETGRGLHLIDAVATQGCAKVAQSYDWLRHVAASRKHPDAVDGIARVSPIPAHFDRDSPQ